MIGPRRAHFRQKVEKPGGRRGRRSSGRPSPLASAGSTPATLMRTLLRTSSDSMVCLRSTRRCAGGAGDRVRRWRRRHCWSGSGRGRWQNRGAGRRRRGRQRGGRGGRDPRRGRRRGGLIGRPTSTPGQENGDDQGGNHCYSGRMARRVWRAASQEHTRQPSDLIESFADNNRRGTPGSRRPVNAGPIGQRAPAILR